AEPRGELDGVAEAREPEGDVRRAAAHVLLRLLALAGDDVDERLAEDEGAPTGLVALGRGGRRRAVRRRRRRELRLGQEPGGGVRRGGGGSVGGGRGGH